VIKNPNMYVEASDKALPDAGSTPATSTRDREAGDLKKVAGFVFCSRNLFCLGARPARQSPLLFCIREQPTGRVDIELY